MASEYKCDICGKPATVHITKIVNSKKVKVHLCSDCAEKMSAGTLNEVPQNIAPKINVINEQFVEGMIKISRSDVCKKCGTSFSDIEKGARFGCPDCYKTFSAKLGEFLAQMQVGISHSGKTPKNHTDDTTLNPVELIGKAIEEVGELFNAESGFEGMQLGFDFAEMLDEVSEKPQTIKPQSEAEESPKETVSETLETLQEKLSAAIRDERFEEAAILRDKINSFSK